MKREDFFFEDEEGIAILLNWDLAKRQGCLDELWLIVDAHTRRVALFRKMAETPVEEKARLTDLAYGVECIEYELQGYWKFKQDRNYHSWWFKVPHCRCPTIDNYGVLFIGRRIITESCPIHWRE